MNSSSSLPYQLRPNKFIDREIFLDLLSRMIPLRGAEKYCYISMGGKHLVDHRSVYKRLGVNSLYSFDGDDEIVARQWCNRPSDHVYCDTKLSGEVIDELDEIIDLFDGCEQTIIWLDYTSAHKRNLQIQEFVRLARNSIPGDIIRITMNANLNNLTSPEKWKEQVRGNGAPTYPQYCASKLRDQLGDFLPTQIKEVDGSSFPEALLASIDLALSDGLKEIDDRVWLPLLKTNYKDKQRMVTATYYCSDKVKLPPAIEHWNFLYDKGHDATLIRAPDLSAKEKHALDDVITKDTRDIVAKLDFLSKRDRKSSEDAVDTYKRLHRYYPAFHNVETN